MGCTHSALLGWRCGVLAWAREVVARAAAVLGSTREAVAWASGEIDWTREVMA